MNFEALSHDHQSLLRLALSIVLAVVLTLARRAVTRRVRGQADVLDPRKRRQIFYIGNGFNLVLALSLLTLWLGQLQDLILSLTAVTVAVVLATKELLMCVSGFALRTGANSFSVGDCIEVAGLRGEVSDFNLLSTTLLEMSDADGGYAHTGQRIVLPNSLFLAQPVRNEKYLRHFVLHTFQITVEPGSDPTAALGWLEQECRQRVAPFAADAKENGANIDQKLGVDLPGPDPEIGLRTTDAGKLAYQIRLFCPSPRARSLEREITAGFLAHLLEQAKH